MKGHVESPSIGGNGGGRVVAETTTPSRHEYRDQRVSAHLSKGESGSVWLSVQSNIVTSFIFLFLRAANPTR